MRTFTHHVADSAKVRLSRDGETLRIEVDGGPVDRITIEVSHPKLDNRLQKSEVIGYIWRHPTTGVETYIAPEDLFHVTSNG